MGIGQNSDKCHDNRCNRVYQSAGYVQYVAVSIHRIEFFLMQIYEKKSDGQVPYRDKLQQSSGMGLKHSRQYW